MAHLVVTKKPGVVNAKATRKNFFKAMREAVHGRNPSPPRKAPTPMRKSYSGSIATGSRATVLGRSGRSSG